MPTPPLLAGLEPVLDSHTRILILGSFPGAASLSASQYYAHPRNQFWRLLGAILAEDLAALSYPARLERVRAHGIGLWDVIAACRRPGSLDSAIRDAQANDFAALRQRAPSLKQVCFNGKTAGRAAPAFAAAGFTTVVLPSSSPAHARMDFDAKLAQWHQILR